MGAWLAMLALWGDEKAEERRLLVIGLAAVVLFFALEILKEVSR